MKIAYVEPFSGISGDMTLGALFEQIEIPLQNQQWAALPVYYGGPGYYAPNAYYGGGPYYGNGYGYYGRNSGVPRYQGHPLASW